TRWQNLARGALRTDLSMLARTLAAEAIRLAPEGGDTAARLAAWRARAAAALDRYQHLLGEIRGAQNIDLAMLSVLLRELRGMTGEAWPEQRGPRPEAGSCDSRGAARGPAWGPNRGGASAGLLTHVRRFGYHRAFPQHISHDQIRLRY